MLANQRIEMPWCEGQHPGKVGHSVVAHKVVLDQLPKLVDRPAERPIISQGVSARETAVQAHEKLVEHRSQHVWTIMSETGDLTDHGRESGFERFRLSWRKPDERIPSVVVEEAKAVQEQRVVEKFRNERRREEETDTIDRTIDPLSDLSRRGEHQVPRLKPEVGGVELKRPRPRVTSMMS